MSRLSNDVNAVEDMVVHGTDKVITDGLRVAITLGIIFTSSWRLALLALAPLPIFLAAVFVFSRFIRPLYRSVREELGDINAELRGEHRRHARHQGLRPRGLRVGKFERPAATTSTSSARHLAVVHLLPLPGLPDVLGHVAGRVARRPDDRVGSGVVTTGDIMGFVGYLQQFYCRFGA